MATLLVVTMSELQTAGMMPYMADDLAVTTGTIGLLVSVYALGMAIGGPLLAIALRRLPPRRALCLVVGGYAVFEVAAPVIHEFWWLALIRVLTGCLAGAMFGLCISFGARLAPSRDRIGRNVAIVMSGLMVGTVVGLPVSHFIAEQWNWQTSFYLLGIAALVICLIDRFGLPNLEPATAEASAQDAQALRKPALWARYLVSLLTIGATYGAFSYFTPLLEQNAGFTAGATTLILLAYGVCTVIGNLIVGRFADDHAVAVLRLGHALILIALVVLGLFNHIPAVTLPFVLVIGLVGVTMNPAMITRVNEVGGSGNLVSTVHTAVITSGVMVGTALGSLTINLTGTDNPAAAMWTGAGLAVLAMIALAIQTGRKRAAGKPRYLASEKPGQHSDSGQDSLFT
ncbi:MFS transporter [Brevibacterium casei]|uniref:MFS transporter n=1 Tax=Brevibacterium casei TaxID=33889 RepID=UPI003F80C861